MGNPIDRRIDRHARAEEFLTDGALARDTSAFPVEVKPQFHRGAPQHGGHPQSPLERQPLFAIQHLAKERGIDPDLASQHTPAQYHAPIGGGKGLGLADPSGLPDPSAILPSIPALHSYLGDGSDLSRLRMVCRLLDLADRVVALRSRVSRRHRGYGTEPE